TLNKWANAHSYYPLDILRIALGAFLFIQGVHFVSNTEYFTELIKPLDTYVGSLFIAYYLASAHLVGGLLIVFGLLTRWAIIAQIPVLIGAILINFMGDFNTSNFILASVTFLICMFFMFYGSGKHSSDYYFKMQQ
ncbi:MAG: DoxX family protein, partial [Xanthomarina sp.]